MNSNIISLYLCTKGYNIIKIMKYVNQTPKTSLQISQATKIPIATTYRLVAQLEKNQYLKSISDITSKGNKVKKYHRGIKYQIIITADGPRLSI